MSETILNMLPLTEEEKAVFEAAAPDAVHLYGRRTATPEQFAQATVILGWPRPNMVAQAAHLKWFHCMWAGTEEYVDVMPAGAALTSSAGTNSQSVSEHLLASLLALYRKLPLCRDRQREHKWDQDIGSVRHCPGGRGWPCGLRLRPAVQGPGGKTHHRPEAFGECPRPRL